MRTLISKCLRSSQVSTLLQSFRRFSLLIRNQRVDIGSSVQIGKGVMLETHRDVDKNSFITIGAKSILDDYVKLETWHGSIEISDRTFIGPFSVIYGQGGVVVGKNVLISMHCRILSSEHSIPSAGIAINSQANVLKKTTIGDDVWIGAGSTILGGVSVGSGAIIGAGSVVTKNIPPNSVAVGVPAKVISERSNSFISNECSQ